MNGKKNELGQYFTPPGVADLMVSLLKADEADSILEPSSGEGVFLDRLSEAGFVNVEGVELDERLNQNSQFAVYHTSFVSWRPEKKYQAVIGNPPYIRWKNLESVQQEEVKTHHLWGELFNSLSDYLTVFIANSVEHLEDGGELIFITPSFWMGTKNSGSLRNWLLDRGSFSDLVIFGESEVFPGVSSAIVIFRYVKARAVEQITKYEFVGGRRVPIELDLDDRNQFSKVEIPAFVPRKHWTIATASEQQIADDLEQYCSVQDPDVLFGGHSLQRLGDYVHIANGMVSGLDKAFRFPEKDIDSLSDVERQALMPVVKARDLVEGQPKQISHYIDVPLGLDEEEFRTRYPNFAEHMTKFRLALLGRYSYDRELPYWEWAFRRSEKFLRSEIPKGFVPCKERLTSRERIRFAVVPAGITATQDVTAFAPLEGTRESIDYIVGYLLTRRVTHWVKLRGLMKGGVAEFSEKPLSEIPFRAINWGNEADRKLHETVSQQMEALRSGTPWTEVSVTLEEVFARTQ